MAEYWVNAHVRKMKGEKSVVHIFFTDAETGRPKLFRLRGNLTHNVLDLFDTIDTCEAENNGNI